MRKVILVDDEIFVRKGLMELIPWEEHGYQVVAEAEDGDEAVALIKQHQPDLVLTDIRMPGMDGLTLIAAIKESGSRSPEFIILSGYNEFSYAQRALRFGVQDFILKPIDEDELVGTLKRINQRWAQLEDSESASHRTVESVLNELLFDQASEQAPVGIAAALGLREQEPCCYCIVECNSRGESAEAEVHSIRKWKTSMGEALMRTGGSAPILHDLGPYTFGFLMAESHFAFHGDASGDRIASQLLRTVSSEEAASIRIYFGPRVTRPADLKRSYDGAREAMRYKYALDDCQAITPERAAKVVLAFRDLDAEVYVALQDHLEENNIPALSELVARIGNDFKRYAFTPDAVIASVSKCAIRALEVLRQMGGEQEPMIASHSVMAQWNQAPKTLSILMKDLMNFLLESASYMEQLRKTKSSGSIHRIRQYIEMHYQEEMTLKSMAKQFYINPVYLGQLFKNTYGVYFNDFLLQLRIDEAKRLLRQTDRKIYEIAEMVGFNSSEYFIKQFEKVEGRSPTDYKQAMLAKAP
ncbi:response regulator transcription factor [Paenibacillus sp. MMS18-CY102]|uniref:response regulator transcription factor n=1 Tax=Paenibacillus sp. MMS18-CY102 TaxID=2682849 RepID=UPI0013667999|nr:response regulator transcription factor [Paenibacillus sp. MMS18-CY102]MWC28618.1 response regulator [Paenibacillus sp. MMS18-CY102]